MQIYNQALSGRHADFIRDSALLYDLHQMTSTYYAPKIKGVGRGSKREFLTNEGGDWAAPEAGAAEAGTSELWGSVVWGWEKWGVAQGDRCIGVCSSSAPGVRPNSSALSPAGYVDVSHPCGPSCQLGEPQKTPP